MKTNKNRSSAALHYFVSKNAIGSLVGVIMLSSTLMVTPDLVEASSTNSNSAYTTVASSITQSNFKDVPNDHSAYDAVNWAKSKGIISGYTDKNGKSTGLFGPNNHVTEAQFAKMVSEYLGLKDTKGDLKKNTPASQWSDTYYDALASYGVPLNGYLENDIRNKPVKRGTVAQSLGYLLGDATTLDGSIAFLIDSEITSGQNPQYKNKDVRKFFGTTNNLTRAQVVSFLYRMDTFSINNIGSYASNIDSKISNGQLRSGVTHGFTLMDKSLAINNNSNNNNNNYVYKNDTNKPITIKDSKSLDKYEKYIINIIGKDTYNKSIGKFELTSLFIPSHSNLSYIYYSSDKKTTIKVTLTPDGKKIDNVSSSGVMTDAYKTLVSGITGISKSKISGNEKDKKFSNSKYEIVFLNDVTHAVLFK